MKSTAGCFEANRPSDSTEYVYGETVSYARPDSITFSGYAGDDSRPVTHVVDGKKYAWMTPKLVALPGVDKVIFNPPATIVYWDDHTRTVVKCMDGDEFNEETGFCMAYLKKVIGDDYKARIRLLIRDAERHYVRTEYVSSKDVADEKSFVTEEMRAVFADALEPFSKWYETWANKHPNLTPTKND